MVSTCINRGVIDHGLADAAELMAPAVIVKLPVVGLAELVRSKRAAGRHKDLDDVEDLEPVLGRSRYRTLAPQFFGNAGREHGEARRPSPRRAR